MDSSAHDPTLKTGSTTRATQPSAGAAPPSPAARYGKFIRERKLGQGGMGEVWKARDSELNRPVALKLLLVNDAEEIARFKREAQVAGRLTHPHIAAIYEVGFANERHFIAMQFVDGQTLKSLPRTDKRGLVRLIGDAARAVQFAHQQGVVHRDLKPENLMVAGSHVYVMDFGLARPTEGASDLSISGLVVGTPAYMPPEQARGEKVDARADVYALGATLYELITDRKPFLGRTVYDTLKAVQEEEPRPPRQLDPSIDADLETIVLKCLEKDRDRRYATAGALADDLAHWLDGEPIAARPISAAERIVRKLRRNKAVAIASVALVAVALVAGIVLLVQRSKSAADLDRAEIDRRHGEDRLKRLSGLWMDILEKKRDLRSLKVPPDRARPALEAAVHAIDAFIREHPTMPQGWYLRGRGMLYLGRCADAEADARKALACAPDFTPAHELIAMAIVERMKDLSFVIREERAANGASTSRWWRSPPRHFVRPAPSPRKPRRAAGASRRRPRRRSRGSSPRRCAFPPSSTTTRRQRRS